MRLTPLDIREQQFRRIMRGLDPEEVATFLVNVAGEFEVIVSENQELRRLLHESESKVGEYNNMEKVLRDTLLTAERVLTESKENAQQEAGLIVREAELAAQRATAHIAQDVLLMRRELVRLRSMKDQYLTRLRLSMQTSLDTLESIQREFDTIDHDLEDHVRLAPPSKKGSRPVTGNSVNPVAYNDPITSQVRPQAPTQVPQVQDHVVPPQIEKWAAPDPSHPPVADPSACDTVPEQNPENPAPGSPPLPTTTRI